MIRGFTATRTRSIEKAEAIPAGWALVATFALSFPILAFFGAPGVTFHDGGEYGMAAASAGVTHSPGAPTWVILNTIFKLFTFGAEAAKSANLFSALCGALTIAFSSVFVFRHFGDRPNTTRWLSTFIVALGLLATGAFLEQSFIAEQYTLMTAFMSGILLLVQSNSVTPKVKNFFFLGLLMGLAIGNHPSQFALAPLMIAVVIQNRKELKWWKTLLVGFLGLTLGLTVYAWIYIRALHHPLLSWGHPVTWEQFMWCIKREQWPTRPMNAAPVGFIAEWIKSYNLFGELGFLTAALGISGIVLGWRRALKPTVWLLAIAVPYAAVMLLGHIRQHPMDLIYIRSYGVRDWHIPLYMVLSMFAAMGAVWLIDMRYKVTEKARTIGLAFVVAILAVTVPAKVAKESMRGDTLAKGYVEDHFKAIPKGAMVAMFNDDLAMMTTYEHYVNGFRKDLYAVFGSPENAYRPNPKDGWTQKDKEDFFNVWTRRSDLNPLNIPRATAEDIATRPFYCEFTSDSDESMAQYMLPTGYLFELKTQVVTDEEVRAKDKELKAKFPELWSGPKGNENRFVREGYSYAHLRRGIYFVRRKMYDLAIEDLLIARKWAPENPQVMFPLGFAYEESKKYVEAEGVYLDCIRVMPNYPSPRQNLGILYFYGKDFDRSLELMYEELKLTKGKKEIADQIKTIEAVRAKEKK